MFELIISSPYFYPDFLIRTNIEEIFDSFFNIYGRSPVTIEKQRLKRNIIIIDVLKKGGDFPQIFFKRSHSSPEISLKTDSPLLYVSKYIQQKRKLCPGFFALHAAAIHKGGETWVLLGNTNTGKTTFVMAMIAKGFQYVTDDCIIIDLHSQKIVPYYQPLKLRKGGVDILRQNYIPIPQLCHVYDSVFDRYIYHPQKPTIQELTVTKLFHLVRANHGFCDEQLNSFDSFQCLIESGLICRSISQDWISCASAFSKKGITRIKFCNFSDLLEYFLGTTC